VFYSHSLHSLHYPYQTAAFGVKQQTSEYCSRKAGYGRGQLSGISDVLIRNEDDDAFQYDWQKSSGMDNEKFDDYVSVDSHLALCESHVRATLLEGAEDEGDDTKPELVPKRS
jgi:hypothetical protein